MGCNQENNSRPCLRGGLKVGKTPGQVLFVFALEWGAEDVYLHLAMQERGAAILDTHPANQGSASILALVLAK